MFLCFDVLFYGSMVGCIHALDGVCVFDLVFAVVVGACSMI